MTKIRLSWTEDILPLLCAAVIAFAITGCGEANSGGADSGDPATESPSASDAIAANTAVVVTPSDMRSVNELTSEITLLHQTLHNWALFHPLLDEQDDYETGPASFEPLIAESFEFSEDRTVITFHLRDGIVWSDGEPITAEDVRWTWQAQTHPDVGWYLAPQKSHIRDVEVVDPLTVRFHFERTYATQLLDANLGVILPQHAWSRLAFSEWRSRADWFMEPENLVVSGPFTLERWDPGERIVLRRNERYLEPGLPKIERVVFRVVPDRASQLALLRTGKAHIVEWARPADAVELERDPDIDIKTFIPRGSNVLIWNIGNPLFAAKETRQALTMALDRQTIIDTLYYGYANVTDSPYTSNLWTSNKDIEPWPHDPERARELLASQGWSDSDGDGVLDRDGKKFSFEILTTTGNELREDILVMAQDQLARVGVEARQRTVEFNTLLTRTRNHEFEVALHGIGIPTNLDLSDFFHSAGNLNMSAYSSPEADRVLERIKTADDLFGAKPTFDELQVILREDLPITVLYEPWRLVPVRKVLHNVTPNALSTYFDLAKWEFLEDS